MVPFDVVTGGNRMLSNSGGVNNLSESFEVLSLSIILSFPEKLKEDYMIESKQVIQSKQVTHLNTT